MESRLDLLNRNLVQKISQANEKKLRKIASTACEIALSHTDIKSPLINLAKKELEESTPVGRSALLIPLKILIDSLDEIQWNLKEQVDLGTETMQNYLKAFCNARAINALYCALDVNPFIAAAESIYEAYAATNDLKTLEESINKILIE